MATRRGRSGNRSAVNTGARRQKAVRVKTAKGRKLSSKRWLERQLNDPYVAEARRLGYRSRAAFKLLELNDQFGLIRPGMRVVDLGAAPGGWTQVAVQLAQEGRGQVVGIDIREWEGVGGATCLTADFLDSETPDLLKSHLGGLVDAVVSDLSPKTTGHPATDHLRIIDLVEHALMFAEEVLAPNGLFVAKVFKGGTETSLLNRVKQSFKAVKHAKPSASRKESPEIYLVATGFRKTLCGNALAEQECSYTKLQNA